MRAGSQACRPRPLLDRGRERLVHRLLGPVEIAEQPDQRGEHPAGFVAVDRLDDFIQTVGSTARTSTTPPCGKVGIRSAIARASSRSRHSRT